MLLAAAGAVAGGLALGRRSSSSSASGAGATAADARYFCPMHRDVRAATPGSCPICGMALARRESVAELSEIASYEVRVARAHTSTRTMRAPARADAGGVVVALLHLDEIALLAADERASFEPAGAGRAPIPVRRRASPPRPWDAGTFEVSFEADAGAGAAPGTPGSIAFAPRRQQIVVIPEGALLQAADGDYVMVASRDDRTFTRRKVVIGQVTFGNIPIVGGLAAGERIATRRTFFLDAGRRLRDPTASRIDVGP
ncbi:MAG TPA: heavy metal-binding domain-containing protein [Polyangia bacterium]